MNAIQKLIIGETVTTDELIATFTQLALIEATDPLGEEAVEVALSVKETLELYKGLVERSDVHPLLMSMIRDEITDAVLAYGHGYLPSMVISVS